MRKSAKKFTVEVCAMCGKVAKKEDYKGEIFVCSHCGSDVSIVMSRKMFLEIAKKE